MNEKNRFIRTGRGFAPSSFVSGPFTIIFRPLSFNVKSQILPDVLQLIQNPESTSGATLETREGDLATLIPTIGLIEFKIRTSSDEVEESVIRKFTLSKRTLLYVGNDSGIVWRDPIG